MAPLIAKIVSPRSIVSRLGTTRIETLAASYQGGVRTTLRMQAGVVMAFVELIPWESFGTSRVLYDGPVDGGPAPPYPSCRDPVVCAKAGYCKRDPACNE